MTTNFTYVLSSADYNERRDIDACFVCVEPLSRFERKRGTCDPHAHFSVLADSAPAGAALSAVTIQRKETHSMKRIFAALVITAFAFSASAALYFTVVEDFADGSSRTYSIRDAAEGPLCRSGYAIYCPELGTPCEAQEAPIRIPLCDRTGPRTKQEPQG